MSFISRDSDFYDVPASTYLGLARDRLSVPHITCLTVNGQDITVGVPVTTGGVQTLSHKSLEDTSTFIIDDVDPTRRIQFDASAITAGSDIIIEASGNGTLTLPDPGGASLTLLGIGPTPLVPGDWTFTNATPSTSTITGTIVNAGGMGVAGAVYIGGVLRVTDATVSTSIITGCATFAGGVGITGATYTGGAIYTSGFLRISDATASTSVATGCATFAGGVGITGALYVGSSTNSAGVLRITDATASTSVATGCATFAGGCGITGALYVGGVMRVTDATASTNSSTGCLVLTGGFGLNGAIHTASSLNAAGVLRISDATASTSVATGCATFAGGVGITGALYVGSSTNSAGVLHVTDVTGSLAPTEGCAIFDGGVGVAGNINIGGDIVTLLGTIGGMHIQCGLAPVIGMDVVRLTELNAITDSTTLETYWVQSSSPYPANRQYIVFRRMYGIIFATFHQSSTSFNISAGDPESITLFDVIPVGWRPRVKNVLQIWFTYGTVSTFMVIDINPDGSVSVMRGGVFVSGTPVQLTTDNTLSWILP